MEAEDGALLPPAAEELDFQAELAAALLALVEEDEDGLEAEEILDFQAVMEQAMLVRDGEEQEAEHAGEQLPAEQNPDDNDLAVEEFRFGPAFDLNGMVVFGHGGGDDDRDDPFLTAFVRFLVRVVLLVAAISILRLFFPPLPPT